MMLRRTLGVMSPMLAALLLAGCAAPASAPGVAVPTTTPPPAPTASTAASAGPTTITVVAPAALLGRAKATDPTTMDLATAAGKGFEPPPGGIKISGAYGSANGKDVLVVVALTGRNADPNEFLDVVANAAFKKSTFHPVDPGPLGGAARCADAGTASTPSTFCLWADAGTFGMMYFMNGAAAQADTLLPQARAQIEVMQ